MSVTNRKDHVAVHSRNTGPNNNNTEDLDKNTIRSNTIDNGDRKFPLKYNNTLFFDSEINKFESDSTQLKNDFVELCNDVEVTAKENKNASYYESAAEISELEECCSDNFVFSDDNDEIGDDNNNYGEVDDDVAKSNVKCFAENGDNLSVICNDEFFSHNFMDSEGSNHGGSSQGMNFDDANLESEDEVHSDIHSRPLEKLNVSVQSDDSQSFLKKISQLALTKPKLTDRDSITLKESQFESDNFCKSSTAFRNAEAAKYKKEDEKNIFKEARQNPSVENRGKSNPESCGRFNLLSSFLVARKKESNKTWSVGSPSSFSQKRGIFTGISFHSLAD